MSPGRGDGFSRPAPAISSFRRASAPPGFEMMRGLCFSSSAWSAHLSPILAAILHLTNPQSRAIPPPPSSSPSTSTSTNATTSTPPVHRPRLGLGRCEGRRLPQYRRTRTRTRNDGLTPAPRRLIRTMISAMALSTHPPGPNPPDIRPQLPKASCQSMGSAESSLRGPLGYLSLRSYE